MKALSTSQPDPSCRPCFISDTRRREQEPELPATSVTITVRLVLLVELNKSHKLAGRHSGILKKNYSQKPQLSSSHRIVRTKLTAMDHEADRCLF